jgi:IclR family transcriptional regulator, acetate operon repressor
MAEQPRFAGIEFPLHPMIAVTADELPLAGPTAGRSSAPSPARARSAAPASPSSHAHPSGSVNHPSTGIGHVDEHVLKDQWVQATTDHRRPPSNRSRSKKALRRQREVLRVSLGVEGDGGCCMSGNSAEPGRTVTSKVVSILTAMTTGDGHTLSTLARQTQLPVSTVYRLLNELARTPAVERTDHGDYRLSRALRDLRVDDVEPTLSSRGPLVVDDLAAALHTTARLGVLDGIEVTYIEKQTGPVPGTTFPNQARLPIHATALGKALLARRPAPLLQVLAAIGLTSYTPRTLTCADQLRHALDLTRMNGFATADRELDPASCAVAVALFDAPGVRIAAIEVQVPDLHADTLAHVLPATIVAARCLRRELASQRRPNRHHRLACNTSTAL